MLRFRSLAESLRMKTEILHRNKKNNINVCEYIHLVFPLILGRFTCKFHIQGNIVVVNVTEGQVR